jgi:hypothetical protein
MDFEVFAEAAISRRMKASTISFVQMTVRTIAPHISVIAK